jgi:hypothetical protein
MKPNAQTRKENKPLPHQFFELFELDGIKTGADTTPSRQTANQPWDILG